MEERQDPINHWLYLEKYDEIEVYLLRMLQSKLTDEDRIICHNRLGISYFLQGNKEKSFEYLDRAIKLSKNNQAVLRPLTNKGIILAFTEGLDNSFSYFENLLTQSKYSKFKFFNLHLALIQQMKGNYDQAWNYFSRYQRVIGKSPENNFRFFEMAEFYVFRNDFDQALQAVKNCNHKTTHRFLPYYITYVICLKLLNYNDELKIAEQELNRLVEAEAIGLFSFTTHWWLWLNHENTQKNLDQSTINYISEKLRLLETHSRPDPRHVNY